MTCEVVAELGVNHNGALATALTLIGVAAGAGCNAVKFQKRTPSLAVPQTQWDEVRDTPFGPMTKIEYRKRVEFGADEYVAIAGRCAALGIEWFASAWDAPSVAFLVRAGCKRIKVPSARVADMALLDAVRASRLPVIMSTGMHDLDAIDRAIDALDGCDLTLLHTVSAYPMADDAANLACMATLRKHNPGIPVGYSGHERGLAISLAAVALGACMVERHVTLDRAMPGSDHAASLEPEGLRRLVRDIRVIESAMGDGVKRIHDCERAAIERLRA